MTPRSNPVPKIQLGIQGVEIFNTEGLSLVPMLFKFVENKKGMFIEKVKGEDLKVYGKNKCEK